MDAELRAKLHELYSANFNDSEPVSERYGSSDMVNVSEVIDFIDDHLVGFIQQEIAKAVNKALVLQFEMDLENLSIHNSIHKLPKEYVVPRKYSLERSIETLKEQKEEL